ncbi:GGDEF domain-containing protein [Patescibacteria group bacterium]|nr:GGDEF domain-containing protein [Patescibacteria group bacterium]
MITNKDKLIEKLQSENMELKRLVNRLERENKIDHLTGLYNRKYLDNRLILKLETLSKYNFPFTIIALDLNNLKKINDTYGHHKGDQYILNFSHMLKYHTRPNDIIVRMGGDEFIILITETNDISKISTDIINRLKEQSKIENIPFSSGFAISNENAHNFELTLKKADENMYTEKKLYYKNLE